jgi:hypothetical protein
VDIFSYELHEALLAPGCPLCTAEEIDERRWMETFVREAYNDAEVRKRFGAARGFCHAHAARFLSVAQARSAVAIVSAVYRGLVEEDLATIKALKANGVPRRRVRGRRPVGQCPACEVHERSAERKLYFFCEALADYQFRRAYSASGGLCSPHFSAALEEAARRYPGVYKLLLDDWLARLTTLSASLSEFERKRDHRYAHEPRGNEQWAPRQALFHYAGTRSSAPESPRASADDTAHGLGGASHSDGDDHQTVHVRRLRFRVRRV